MCGQSLLEITTELIFGLSLDELHSHPVSLQPYERTNDPRMLLIRSKDNFVSPELKI
ncbi:hypothetical protein YTPLAS72_01760 [Nitrospira sp.]|nr:hypothetical protein YTPLAS72_01760 [Nitrospira sp.]